MAKTLTPLQERMIARLMAHPADTLYLREGSVHSVNNLKAKNLIDPHCYTMLHYGYLTPEIKSIFWSENRDVFAIEDMYKNRWHVFEDREVIAECRSEAAAERVVAVLKASRGTQKSAA
jgi:hypothetical protein